MEAAQWKSVLSVGHNSSAIGSIGWLKIKEYFSIAVLHCSASWTADMQLTNATYGQ
jgi:hypothetical protein